MAARSSWPNVISAMDAPKAQSLIWRRSASVISGSTTFCAQLSRLSFIERALRSPIVSTLIFRALLLLLQVHPHQLADALGLVAIADAADHRYVFVAEHHAARAGGACVVYWHILSSAG